MQNAVPEFLLPLIERDQGWIEIREQIAHAAREMHFFAVSGKAVNGAALLIIAGNLAELAMSIPMRSSQTNCCSFADAPTLLATSVLQYAEPAEDDTYVVIEEG